jgi:sialic acid synthase SpsE
MTDHLLTVDGMHFSPHKVLVIAEIGTGHRNDRRKGDELAAAAVGAGADCVKFQHVYADEIIHPATGMVPLPGGTVPLYERFRELETGPGFMEGMKDTVERLGALFLCSPFGVRSARELRAMGVRAMKVASPELNFTQLLDELGSYCLPTILSTGVSTLSDIEQALEHFPRHKGGLALLHCVTAYPAPETDYNLRILPLLSGLLGIAVGVSDHSLDPVLVPALSVACGGSVVEKHFCLSRGDKGLDDPIALEPDSFAEMVRAVRLAEKATAPETIAALGKRCGSDTVEAVLGSGRKELAPSERGNYLRTNRSIHARRPIAKGEVLDAGNLAVLRTEKILRPGIHPRYLGIVSGRKAARDIPDGEGVEWEDVGGF